MQNGMWNGKCSMLVLIKRLFLCEDFLVYISVEYAFMVCVFFVGNK